MAADDLIARLDRIVHSDAPYGTTLRDTVRDAEAEVRALRDVVRRHVYGWHVMRDIAGDWWAHPLLVDNPSDRVTPAEAAVIRAATADPTPLPDLLKAARERGRRAAVLPPDAADPTPPPETP